MMDSVAINESLGFSVATHYQVINNKNQNFFGKGTSALVGFHYGYFDLSNIDTDDDGSSFFAQCGDTIPTAQELMACIHLWINQLI